MRRLLASVMIVAALIANAVAYTPSTVPDVHRADRNEFVANPDGILSQATVGRLNLVMSKMRRQLTVEPMVVVVNEINADYTPEEFATDLFEHWGLGKADRDNGLLVFVDMSTHAVVIRPGYGLEGVLPDIVCGRIIREVFVPAARQGDIDAAVLNSVKVIDDILSDPEAAEEYRSSARDADYNAGDDDDAFRFYILLMACVAVAMLAAFCFRLYTLRGRSDYDKYRAFAPWKPAFLVLTVGGLLLPLIATVPLLLCLNRWRNKPHVCPNCSTKMYKVDEVHDNEYLTPAQDLEERIGSVDYDVWLCPQCGETDVLAYILPSSTYKECENCHHRTARPVGYRVVKAPTAMSKGLAVKEYQCLNCNHHSQERIELPRDNTRVAGAAAAGAILGGRGGFGGGSFGGGFGGGHTGGGGASGHW